MTVKEFLNLYSPQLGYIRILKGEEMHEVFSGKIDEAIISVYAENNVEEFYFNDDLVVCIK